MMKKIFGFFTLPIAILIIGLSLIIPATSAQEYVITDFGVKTDSTVLNTVAIQTIIDGASSKGGGTIVVPKGVFLTGALFFKPHTRLRLAEGAVLKGSDDINDYPLIPSRMEGKSLDYYAALVNAYNVDSFSITGPGTIDGNGLRFWKQFWAYRDSMAKIDQEATNLDVHRPRLVFLWGSNNAVIRDVSLHNSGFWTTHLYKCNNVLIENCDIRAPHEPIRAPSTDGVDIDFCRDVTIRNCYIAVNDDGVCIKGGKGPLAQSQPENGIVENVLVENCSFGFVHATLTMGSECIHAKNIILRNCKVDNEKPLLRLKMRPDTYQLYEDIKVENVTGNCGPIIYMLPWKQFFNMEGTVEKPFGTIRNIVLSNIDVNCESLGIMAGNPNDTVSNVVFRNIRANAKDTLFVNKYSDVRLENVSVNGKPFEWK